MGLKINVLFWDNTKMQKSTEFYELPLRIAVNLTLILNLFLALTLTQNRCR